MVVTNGGTPDEPIYLAGSQFIITLGDDLESLDTRAVIFGHIEEGFDTLEKIDTAICDQDGRPMKDIRIKHSYILEDPFEDPEGLEHVVPPESPAPSEKQLSTVRIGDGEEGVEEEGEDAEKRRQEQDARAQALTLEMVGDLPFAEVKPMENVLFVCKLNPVTRDEDLELIFSRFGPIISCEVIRDKVTGDSLQYAFIEYEKQEDCERAFLKMDGVLIDDNRIHVDFSQSVSRLSDSWRNETNVKRKLVRDSKFGRDVERRDDRGNDRRDSREDDWRDSGGDRDRRDSRRDYREDGRRDRRRAERRDDRRSGRREDKWKHEKDDSYHRSSGRSRGEYSKSSRGYRDRDY